MRILVHGLQSSGASFFTFLLGQNPNSVVIPDLYNRFLMPEFNDINTEVDLIVKCVITSMYDIEDHQNNFKPDKSILLIRHPIHNYQSLVNKPYSNNRGSIGEKFQKADELWLHWFHYFDLVLHYEDIFFNSCFIHQKLNEQGIPFNKANFEIKRDLESLINYTKSQSHWLRDNYQIKWGSGKINFKNHQKRALFKPYGFSTVKVIRHYSPNLLKHYRHYKPDSRVLYYNLWLRSWSLHQKEKLYSVKKCIQSFFLRNSMQCFLCL